MSFPSVDIMFPAVSCQGPEPQLVPVGKVAPLEGDIFTGSVLQACCPRALSLCPGPGIPVLGIASDCSFPGHLRRCDYTSSLPVLSVTLTTLPA